METWIFSEHIREQAERRFPKLESLDDELNRIYNALGRSAPDDWRLSRFSPGFIIRDIKTGITLIGKQKRRQTNVIKFVNTCIEQGGFVNEKRAKFLEREDSKRISSRPNLFVGDNSVGKIFQFSPVLARQYEKVNPDRPNKEYFNCIPLTKNGLNKKEPVWIGWSHQSGKSIINDNPPKEFHGEDFWRLES